MTTLSLIGIGTGNPDHLTLQAIREINAADLVLIPRKGEGKADLAELRRAILREVLTNPSTRVVEFDLPVRDETVPDYRARVDGWHDAIAGVWQAAMGSPRPARVALLVWGDPSLYDSTLRIASRLRPLPEVKVIPGITSLQALTAAHAIPLNTIGGPVTITTGRQLRDHGWPECAETVAVMLDAGGAFTAAEVAREQQQVVVGRVEVGDVPVVPAAMQVPDHGHLARLVHAHPADVASALAVVSLKVVQADLRRTAQGV